MAGRRALLYQWAEEYARVTLRNVRTEFPNDIRSVMRAPGDFPNRPREVHPAFYGCYDWHSCVEMHWLLVRLLRVAPDAVPANEIRAVLAEHLSAEALAVEAQTFAGTGGWRARPYGWGWVLALSHELHHWDDPDSRIWAEHMVPLADEVHAAFLHWLPLATYPVRQGAHQNSAFGLSRALPYARTRAAAGDADLLGEITDAAFRWYLTDADYPGRWEPSGSDFLSPALTEAELMASLLPSSEFLAWFNDFLPGIAAGEPAPLFTPATVSDDTDGLIAHLHGLNLSRAWCWLRLAAALPADDTRVPRMLDAAAQHAEAELDQASGSDYAIEHWLACYAVLYLTAGGVAASDTATGDTAVSDTAVSDAGAPDRPRARPPAATRAEDRRTTGR